jgi:DsbC/DsbD-like thiol-disulfide interchange protein
MMATLRTLRLSAPRLARPPVWRVLRRGRPVFLAAAAFAASAAPGQAPSQAPLIATSFVEADGARVRLLAGPAPAGARTYVAGIEIALAPGWKTYWRTPGEAGVPPAFDWTGSRNVASPRVLYPAPMRLEDAAATSIGYTGRVIFPVEVAPVDAKTAGALALRVEFGICKDICIPVEARLALELPAEPTGTTPHLLTAALDRVPRPPALQRPQDPKLGNVTATFEGPSPHILIEAAFATPEGGDLFVEAPAGAYVPLAKHLGAREGKERFRIDLVPDEAQELKGKPLLLTLVGASGASETPWNGG